MNKSECRSLTEEGGQCLRDGIRETEAMVHIVFINQMFQIHQKIFTCLKDTTGVFGCPGKLAMTTTAILLVGRFGITIFFDQQA